ncbi:MAG: diacylglycerol kinase family lipid kinase [Caldisericia bacterium]|jgi:YegS/Rv2252/BmrU family lipid kinase|nr:diacylglycerol kinase family lipid kinase [Caldisericia bacterium]
MKESKNYFFIVNPVAGVGKALKVWSKIKKVLENLKVNFEYMITEYPGHATEIAKEAIKKGFKYLISVGGDGTTREIAQGIENNESVLGIIPAGRGRDLPRSLNIPKNPIKALELILNDGNIVEIDHPKLDSTRFLNFSGIGLDAEVAYVANKKFRGLGILSYLLGLFYVIYYWKIPEFILKIDGEIRKVKAYLITIANGKYGGGGMQISPLSDIKDGFLDVIIFHKMPKLRFLYHFPKVYTGGGHIKISGVECLKCKKIEVHGESFVKTQADGDLFGGLPKIFEIDNKKIKVLTGLNVK